DGASDVSAVARTERLKNSIVLRVDRENCRTAPCSATHEKTAGTNEAFFIREGDCRAPFDGRKGGLQTNRTTDRCHHPVSRSLRSFHQCLFAGRSFYSRTRKRVFEFQVGSRIRDNRMSGTDLTSNLAKTTPVPPPPDRLDTIP